MKLDIDIPELEFVLALDDLVPEALSAAMPVLVSATKDSIREVVRHPDRSTDDLIDSVSAGNARRTKGGGFYAPIRFTGTGSNGTRNGLKAAELEYGNSQQPATPFADRAVHAVEDQFAEIVENYLEKKLNK